MSKKLLLADDSVTVQRVIELTFADEGLEVVSVGDGASAIERAEQDRPDIILVDVGMPGRDGYQVAEYVKASPHLAHIPVVLMTGAFEQIDETRAATARCDAVLAKPFEPHMVIALVQQLLRGESPADQGVTSATPAPTTASKPGPPAPDVRTGSLDDYLEQLDEALTSATAGARPAANTAPAAASTVAAPGAGPTAGADTPSLADAFSFLLAEELGKTPLPAAWGTLAGRIAVGPAAAAGAGPLAARAGRAATAAPSVPVIPEAIIEEITRRVAQRLADSAVRELVESRVIEVAERLVREEIERIKSSAR